VEYEDAWGHRGLMHSLLFALGLAMVIVTVFFRKEAAILGREWWKYTAFFFAATASHGVLDAFTDGGLGIAFFSPFDQTRYFFPWNPVHVAPIGLSTFFTRNGWLTMRSELMWIWLPTISMLAVVLAWRRGMGREKAVGRRQ
jgi:inner membrane protein